VGGSRLGQGRGQEKEGQKPLKKKERKKKRQKSPVVVFGNIAKKTLQTSDHTHLEGLRK
jgi:hypothetical protein